MRIGCTPIILARCYGRGVQAERSEPMSAFIITRIHVGDYDAWRPMFDQDRPRAREKARVQRVFRAAQDPNHVFVFLDYASLSDAEEAARRLNEAGAVDRVFGQNTANVHVETR